MSRVSIVPMDLSERAKVVIVLIERKFSGLRTRNEK